MPAIDRDGSRERGVVVWQRAVDRAVMSGWACRVLAVLGIWVAACALAIAVFAALDLATAGRVGIAFLPPFIRVAIVAATAVLAVVAVGRLTGFGPRPTRLGVALATERQHPQLGERLSRAVEFLDAGPAVAGTDRHATGEAATTQSLRQLAIEHAAAAARGVGRLAVPDFAANLRWLATGVAVPLALWLSTAVLPPPWAAAVLRQLTAANPAPQAAPGGGPPGGTATPPLDAAAPAAPGLPPSVIAAGQRIRAAAAVERRMADVLAALFARSPGLLAESLPRESRRELDQLAAIQAECLRTIFSDRDTLRAAAGSVAGDPARPPATAVEQAIARLADLDQRALSESPLHIAANRLSLAGGIAAAAGDILADAADALGIAPATSAAVGIDPAGRSPAAGSLQRATAAIERISAAHRRTPDTAPEDDNGPTATIAADTAGRGAPAGTGPGVPSAPGDGGDTTAAATSTTDPRSGAGSGASPGGQLRPPGSEAAAARPIERVWNLLPDHDRPETAREAREAMPAAYQPAIDAYYRLLLQSLPNGLDDAPGAAPASSPQTTAP